jgi:predicted nuclease of predicted toxin-antitoxin system
MKLLLFDQNLSPRLVNLLADIYPDSAHVIEGLLRENYGAIAALSDTPNSGIISLF